MMCRLSPTARAAAVLAQGVLLALFVAPQALAAPLTGTVIDADGQPIAGAHIRLSAVPQGGRVTSGDDSGLTDEQGRFSVESPAARGDELYIGIAKPGYMILGGRLNLQAGLTLGQIPLDPLPVIDNVNYQWWKPFWPLDDNSDIGCNACHGVQYRDWSASKMAGSARNPRVLSLYLGTDIDGRPAGPGFRLDNPDQAGPCANCHAAAASIDAPFETVLSEVSGIAEEGVFCDVCHKVRDVDVDGGAGVGGSLLFGRPPAWVNLFAFGPLDDGTLAGGPMRAAYSEVMRQARFCAGCHQWTNDNGVPVLSTFSEWSEAAGADPDALQCQDCHMKKKFGRDYQGEDDAYEFILDNTHMQRMAGVRRKTSTIYPHRFWGAAEYIEEAADLGMELAQEGNELVVRVDVENVNAGHALPTGMPFRHLILLVEATVDGVALEQRGGPTVPDYGGEGDGEGDLAGRPGKGYAKVLGDGTGARNVQFWNATEIIEDTRIRALESDTVELRFAVPASDAEVEVSTRLLYRRTFEPIKVVKKWDVEDVEMATASESFALTAADPSLGVDAGRVDPSSADGGAPAQPTDDDGDDREGGGEGGCGCSEGGGPAGLLPLLLLVVLGPIRRRR